MNKTATFIAKKNPEMLMSHIQDECAKKLRKDQGDDTVTEPNFNRKFLEGYAIYIPKSTPFGKWLLNNGYTKVDKVKADNNRHNLKVGMPLIKFSDIIPDYLEYGTGMYGIYSEYTHQHILGYARGILTRYEVDSELVQLSFEKK